MTKDQLRRLRIGYATRDRTLGHAADRRRFTHYARRRGLDFAVADPGARYDLLIVGATADVSLWEHYRGGGKLIFESLDSYRALGRRGFKARVRGLAKFAAGQAHRPLADYAQALARMAERADAVICATEEQRADFVQFCANAHVILDFHAEFSGARKTDYATGPVFNLVWEGFPEILAPFRELRSVLRELHRARPLALHVITDLEYGRWLNRRVGRTRTTDRLRRLVDVPCFLYAWNARTAPAIMAACDLAVIPLDLSDSLSAGKPENKLLIFWRLGVPAVVSASPAYMRAMRGAGLGMACASPGDWSRVLAHYMDDEPARREAGARGRKYAETEFSEEKTLLQWDDAIASALDGPGRATPMPPPPRGLVSA